MPGSIWQVNVQSSTSSVWSICQWYGASAKSPLGGLVVLTGNRLISAWSSSWPSVPVQHDDNNFLADWTNMSAGCLNNFMCCLHNGRPSLACGLVVSSFITQMLQYSSINTLWRMPLVEFCQQNLVETILAFLTEWIVLISLHAPIDYHSQIILPEDCSGCLDQSQ